MRWWRRRRRTCKCGWGRGGERHCATGRGGSADTDMARLGLVHRLDNDLGARMRRALNASHPGRHFEHEYQGVCCSARLKDLPDKVQTHSRSYTFRI